MCSFTLTKTMSKSKLIKMGCYICGEPSTSDEHAPAKCFFPVNKRINLTTVPSCSIHNNKTSKDDEYVRNIISMALGNNNVAVDHFMNKCKRSFEKSQKLLQATISGNSIVYYKEKENDEIKSTYALMSDRQRIELVMRKIAYATHFKKYGTTWNRELIIGSEFLRETGMGTDDLGTVIQEAKNSLNVLGAKIIYEGNNQDVFKFSFRETGSNDSNDKILIMVFYEGFEVWVFTKIGTTAAKI